MTRHENITLFKAEKFLISHLKEEYDEDKGYKVGADCSMIEFLNKFEQAMKE